MNIQSDSIKKKTFKGAIQSGIQKHSQEYRVLATLRYMFPGKYENMLVLDSPDLQDSVTGVGIEVVTAIKSDEMKAEREFSYYCKPRSAKDSDKHKKIIENLGFEVHNTPYGPALTGPAGTSCSEELIFKKSICEKVKKGQKYKQSFSSVGLAVLLIETPTREAENSYISWIRQVSAKLDHEFDFYFVISERFCLYFNPVAGIDNKIIISGREAKSLRTIARMTAEGELSLSSPEWN